MLFSDINLVQELQKDRKATAKLISEVNDLLLSEAMKDCLDPNRIFTTDQIRKICINYRLRFLDVRNFKGEIPEEGKSKLEELQKNLNIPENDVKIVAPAKLFHLEDKDSDPLLLLSIGKDKYYLVHQWGKDLKWYRKLQSYPLRSLLHYIGVIVAAAFLFAQAVPIMQLPGVDGDNMFSVFRLYIFAFTLISFCSLSSLYLFMFRTNFSDQEWRSKYMS